MCGIMGYIGRREKKGVLIDGLKELEYRGYDSAGIGVLGGDGGSGDSKNGDSKRGDSKNGGTIKTFKAVGKLENLSARCAEFESYGFGVGIGHTRWATHGKPTETNAHPHIAEGVNVVHNGIIENYQSIKADLESRGFVFASQTDTEIVAKLFEFNLANAKTPLAAFSATIAALKGAYAILLITTAAPDSIFYAKFGSPLIIGVGDSNGDGDSNDKSGADSAESEIFFSSSDAPLIGQAKRVVYLEDGDLGQMKLGGFGALKGAKELTASRSSAQKDGFRYFMEKEIYEQSSVLLDTMMGRVSEKGVVFDELDSEFFSGVRSVTICACGTSYHAGMVGKYLLERAGMKTSVVIASEYRYAEPILEQGELFLAISQSGETADTLEALKLAKRGGARTLAVCNVDNSSIVRESEACLLTRAGIEKGVASTKAFATQVMVLWMLSAVVAEYRARSRGDASAQDSALAQGSAESHSAVIASEPTKSAKRGNPPVESSNAATKNGATGAEDSSSLRANAAINNATEGDTLNANEESTSGLPRIRFADSRNDDARAIHASNAEQPSAQSATDPKTNILSPRHMLAAARATAVDAALHERVKKLSKRYLHGHGFFFIGRDVFYPLALEGALKLKEISYLHAEGYASGEMKHGPIALADAELFCVALMPEHLLHEKIKSNVAELSARDATICAVSSVVEESADDMLLLPKAESYMEEFFSMMVALQLLALEIAIRLGNDVDMPRNLAKSVTVE